MSDDLLHAAVDSIPYSRPDTPHIHLQIGFLGLGSMGYLMARNLASHIASTSKAGGFLPLLLYNRTEFKAQALAKELGADKVKIAPSPAHLAIHCDVVITNLASDTVVKAIYEQFGEALKIFVETSTIYPTLAGELDILITSVSYAHLITCPVFGAPRVADKAQLLLIMSGDYRSKKEIAHLLVPAIGRKVIDLGENLEKAPTFKLIGNSMILGTLEILAESFTLASKSGIASGDVNKLVNDLLPADLIISYAERIGNDLFDGTKGFAIDGGIKDASHIHRLTVDCNSPMPAIDIAHQHLLTARALHAAQKLEGKEMFDTLDWTAIVAGCRVGAGLDGLDSAKNTNIAEQD